MEIGWICTEILCWILFGQSRSFVSEFHREYERCDFHFGAPSFKLVGEEGGGRAGRRAQFLLLLYLFIFTRLIQIKTEEV